MIINWLVTIIIALIATMGLYWQHTKIEKEREARIKAEQAIQAVKSETQITRDIIDSYMEYDVTKDMLKEEAKEKLKEKGVWYEDYL